MGGVGKSFSLAVSDSSCAHIAAVAHTHKRTEASNTKNLQRRLKFSVSCLRASSPALWPRRRTENMAPKLGCTHRRGDLHIRCAVRCKTIHERRQYGLGTTCRDHGSRAPLSPVAAQRFPIRVRQRCSLEVHRSDENGEGGRGWRYTYVWRMICRS